MQTGHRISTLARTLAAIALATALGSGLASGQQAKGGAADWSAVDQALGRKGAPQPGDVMKYGFPRSDLQVMVNGVGVKPGFALGSWVAFKRSGRSSAMMGDLVLTEDEVAPVMRALQQGGVEQTALHNHLFGETPRVMYMHVMGHGDAVKLAEAVRNALGTTKTPLEAPPAPPAAPAAIDLDTAAIAGALGVSGKVNGGVYQVAVPRRERVTDHGMEVPPSMGVATSINFQPTSGGKAAITGDFVMIASEVNPVIRALEDNGITITALHSHMLTESPRLFFMHFWANDDASTLAKGLRAALDKMAVKTSAKKGSQ